MKQNEIEMTKMPISTADESDRGSNEQRHLGRRSALMIGMSVGLLCMSISIYIKLRNNQLALEEAPFDPLASLPEMPILPGPDRFAPLDPTDKNSSFVHISKCAGTSWYYELKPLSPTFYPTMAAGQENSISWSRENHPSNYLFTSIKSPHHHVWSLFSECKYSPWGVSATRNTGFPRSGNDSQSDLVDFNIWLDAFVTPNISNASFTGTSKRNYKINRNRRGGFGGCYHPSNYISRVFAFNERNPKAVGRPLPGLDRFEPPIDDVIKTYWTLDWVAVAELYSESKCLIYYRFMLGEQEKANTSHFEPEKLTTTKAFLDNDCRCPVPNQTHTNHVTHHKEGHRTSMRDGISKETLQKIDALTKVDFLLYKHALTEFMRELMWLEDQLERRILCDSKLESLNYELEYLGFGNLTAIYLSTKDKHGYIRF